MSTETNQVKWVGVRLAAGENGLPVLPYQLATANESGTQVSIGITATTILAANSNRLACIIKNMSPTTVYIKLGAGATITSFELEEGDIIGVDVYTGIITGIVASGSATISVIEI